ncbi:MAG: pyridoxamine 5'-phosphate oxidase family protein [Massilia sp.]
MSTSIPSGWPFEASPFHRGERLVQEKLGVRAQMEARARIGIRDFLPEQHRAFFAQLPLVLVGSVDADGQPWASVLAAPPGFMRSPDPRHLDIRAGPLRGDPLAGALTPGAPIGLLGIEAHTRRRNRVSGSVEQCDADGFSLRVTQSFGNCPKYIQARQALPLEATEGEGGVPPAPVQTSNHLTPPMRALIARADTYFIASAYGGEEADDELRRGVDVSHRGGKPGFVKVGDDMTLSAPEFVGNNFYNTTGNLVLNPRAGLLFIDVDNGDLLYLAARAEVVWDGPEVDGFAGAQRLLRFRLVQAILVPRSLPLRWSEAEQSPYLAPTGHW